MSTNSEDAHLPSWALSNERTLALLDLQQQQRRHIDYEQELDVILAPHHLEIDDTWEAEIESVNYPPVPILPWSSRRNIEREQGDYTITLTASDGNPSDTHLWTLVQGGASFATVSGGVLTLDTDHTTATVGNWNVIVQVEDSGGATARMTIRFRLVNPNYRPVLTTSYVDDTIPSLDEWTSFVRATDRNNDVLTYSYSITPEPKSSKINFNDKTGTLKWTPNKADEGITFSISYEATDGKSDPVSSSHEITVVAATATPPRIVSKLPDPIARREGRSYRYGAVANDSDTGVTNLKWTKVSGPGSIGATTYTVTGGLRKAVAQFTWTAPTVSSDTNYEVVLKVTATGGNPANESKTMTIELTANANEAPDLATIRPFSVRRGESAPVTITATDFENDPLEFYEHTAFPWITVSGSGTPTSLKPKVTGTLRAAPPLSTALGEAEVTVGVREISDHTHKDTENLVVTITEAESSPPVFVGTPANSTVAASKAGTTVNGTYIIQDTGVGKATGMKLTVESGNATVRGSGVKLTNDRWSFPVRATYPAAGQSDRIIVKATATGGTPSGETEENNKWVLTTEAAAVDYSPNITITAPANNSRHSHNGKAVVLEITAIKHDGSAIPLKDLTVTQTPATDISFWAKDPDKSPQYMDDDALNQTNTFKDKWWVGLHQDGTGVAGNASNTDGFIGNITVTVSYTDTVNSKAYTTTKSITIEAY